MLIGSRSVGTSCAEISSRMSLKEAVAPRFAKLVVSEFYFTVFDDLISCK